MENYDSHRGHPLCKSRVHILKEKSENWCTEQKSIVIVQTNVSFSTKGLFTL